MRSITAMVRTMAALAVLAAIGGSASSALADPGEIDLSFNGTGERIVTYSTDIEFGVALVVSGDGRPVLVGSTFDDFTVTRFRLDGGLDRTFSGDGRLRVDFGRQDSANGAGRQGSKTLVVGQSGGHAAVVRLRADGTRDTSFSGDGRARVVVPGTDSSTFNAVVDAGDGKVLAVGSLNTEDNQRRALIVRFTAAGALDTTFSGDGIRVIDGFKPTFARDALVLSNGSILVLVNDPSVRVVRLKAGGATDTTYGTQGSARPAIPFKAAAFARDGSKVVIAGTANDSTMAITRLLASGAPDTTFRGSSSMTLIEDPEAFGATVSVNDVAVTADHEVLLAASTNGNQTILRLAAGVLDTTFNGGLGYVEVGGAGADAMVGVGLDPDGRILGAGHLGGVMPEIGDQSVIRILNE